MSIPIGAPVTVTWRSGEKTNFVITGHRTGGYFKYEAQSESDGTYCLFNAHEFKIRYDSPASFTLWQLNSLVYNQANTNWHGFFS